MKNNHILCNGIEYKYSGHGDLYVSRDGGFIRRMKNGSLKQAVLTDSHKNRPHVAVRYLNDNGRCKELKAMNVVYDAFVRPIENKHTVFTRPIDGNIWNLNADNITTYDLGSEEMIGRRHLTIWRDTSVPGIRCSRDGQFINRYGGKLVIKEPNRYRKHAFLYTSDGLILNAAREMYDAWVGKSDAKQEEVVPKDGNPTNLNADNLIAVRRGDLQRQRMVKHFQNKISAEEVLKDLSIRKTELDLAIYFCTTGKFDRYNEYVNNVLYKRLYDYGITNIRGGAISDENVMNYTAEAISILYELIDKNRGVATITTLGKKIMLRLSKKYKKKLKYEYGVKAIRRPIDEINFAELAKKYGLTEYVQQ